MDLFNKMLLFFELGGNLSEFEPAKQIERSLKLFRQQYNLSFVKDIPEFKDDYIIHNAQKIFVGSIIKRPLTFKYISTTVEFHYGAVLGTSINGEELLIEMTKGKNVRLVTKKEFLIHYQIESIELPPKGITREQIIKRATELQFETYSLLDLNCKWFVNYCVWDIKPPKMSIELKKIQLDMIDLAIQMRKLQLSSPENNNYKSFLSSRILQMERNKEKLSREIEEHVNSKNVEKLTVTH